MGNKEMCCGQQLKSQSATPIQATVIPQDSIVNKINNTDFRQKVFNKIKTTGNQGLLKCQLRKVANSQQHIFYQGLLNENLQGKGFMYTTKAFYAGDLKEGEPHGIGIAMFQNGGQFQGRFQNGQPDNGTYRNGDYQYKGQIKSCLKNGLGEEHYKQNYFKGKFLNGLRQQGKFFPNKDNPSTYYQGLFQNDKPIWGNYRIPGATISQFTLDEQTQSLAHGKIVFDNGDIYEGGLKDGKMQGAGTYKFKGKLIKGKFRNGQLQSE